MLFHTFNLQEERRNYGGSAFVEIQFCKLSSGIVIDRLVAVDGIDSWQDGSLYIDDENVFYKEYNSVFDCGIYNNLRYGTVDVYGISYHTLALIDSIIERLRGEKPVDYEVLIEWLIKLRRYNGFYILGL